MAEQTALNRMVAGSTPATPTRYARLHRLVWSKTLLCRSGDRGTLREGFAYKSPWSRCLGV